MAREEGESKFAPKKQQQGVSLFTFRCIVILKTLPKTLSY